jgi:hypothetical protein
MGIACKARDVIMMSKMDSFDGIGLNLKNGKNSFPLLYTAEEFIFKKFKDMWVHGYSVPRSYHVGEAEGTVGILVNTFGIDSFSPFVGHTGGAIEPGNAKYFNPSDYSVTSFNNLLERDYSDHKLSEFCGCSVCKNHTVNSITSADIVTFKASRAHEILAHKNESDIFKEKIRESTSNQYLKSKSYASKLIFG